MTMSFNNFADTQEEATSSWQTCSHNPICPPTIPLNDPPNDSSNVPPNVLHSVPKVAHNVTTMQR